jgi:hypothetical protein
MSNSKEPAITLSITAIASKSFLFLMSSSCKGSPLSFYSYASYNNAAKLTAGKSKIFR